MTRNPTRVQMLNRAGSVQFEMTGSVPRLRDRGYTGNARAARVIGPRGAGVTFYDDQQYRTGENYVYIETTTAEPIDVPIATNFVTTKEKAPAGVFRGEAAGYKWILFKNPKAQFWSAFLNPILDAVDGVINWDKLVSAAANSGYTPFVLGGKTLGWVTDKGRRSTNYRVDNCSSVKFGPV